MSLDILVVGNGAREHALIWKLSQSDQVERLLCAPGNAGTGEVAENVDVDVLDSKGLLRLATSRHIDLVTIGPEAPLAAGLADRLRERGVPVFGPSQAAARIESSKAWSKALMNSVGIPTAKSSTHTKADDAREALSKLDVPVVIKADGLAAGKGVTIAETVEDARQAVDQLLESGSMGDAGSTIVIEEFLSGMEISIFGLTDGTTIVPFLPSCDYKRASTGDAGPNTGGMGAYAPVPRADDAFLTDVLNTILAPAVQSMSDLGCLMNGVLYAGIMLTDDGPKVLEFNARFGDPEIQVLLPLLQSDLAHLLNSVANNHLSDFGQLEWRPEAAVGVVLASGGYPGSYETGYPITGLQPETPGTMVFHAGTATKDSAELVTAGGRVLTVVGTGSDLERACATAYERVEGISFHNVQYRTDIAKRELAAAR